MGASDGIPTARRRSPRRRVGLGITTTLALAAPLAASAYVEHRVEHGLGVALTRATGQPSRVGGVDVGLAGTVRLTDLQIGGMLRADAVEAAVALPTLLRGEVAADEIRVEGPRVHGTVGPDGTLDLLEVARRVLRARADSGAPVATRPTGRLRRILVSGGVLRADLAGYGSVTVADIEVTPGEAGLRLVTGRVETHVERAGLEADSSFERVGADIDYRGGALRRLLAVRGDAQLRRLGSTSTLALDQVSLAQGLEGDARVLWLRADALDEGVPRRLVLALDPGVDRRLRVEAEGLPLGALADFLPDTLEAEHAAFQGSAVFAMAPSAGLGADVHGALRDIRFRDRDLAAEAVPLDIDGALRARVEGGTVTIERADLGFGAARVHGSGRLTVIDRALATADLAFELAPAPCLALLESVPAPMRGALEGLTLEGTLTGRAQLAVDLAAAPGSGVQLQLDLPSERCRVVADAPLGDPRALAGRREQAFPDGSTRMTGPGTPGWVALVSLPPHVPGAFVAAEDDGFWRHHGFDLRQIASSLEVDLRQRRLARGGSTITQQLVKNVFLSQRRTLDRKLQEAVLAWRVEATTSKQSILENYLNIVELGPGVFGIEAASQYWFGREARRLTPRQAAFLAALTPEPRSWHGRLVRAGRIDDQSLARIEQVLRQMKRTGAIDKATYEVAILAPLTLQAAALRPAPAVARR